MKEYQIMKLLQILILAILPVISLMAQSQDEAEPLIKEISFKTEDGWTIYGTYYVPQGTRQTPIPGLVALSEPGGGGRSILTDIAEGVVKNGISVLTIDMRGTDASFGNKDYEMFSQEELDNFQLDIRAAVKFLASQKEVDKNRIAIFGANITADYVVREAAINATQVKALVLSTGWLSDEGRKSIKFRKDLPILAIASEDDPRPIQSLAAEPYFLSEDKSSRLMFVTDRGASIFNRLGQPDVKVIDWLKNILVALGTRSEVSFKTGDGVTLRGTLYKPNGFNKNDQQVGGVIFIHSANRDSTTWYHLAQEVTKTGLAALIFDQRGYRTSIGEKAASSDGTTIQRDIKAAINFLASQSGINPNRLALITAASRGGPGVAAAYGDVRIRTLVGLSFFGANDDTRRYLAEMDIPLFLVASTNDIRADGRSLADGTREAYRLSQNKETELLMYEGAGRGSSMMKTQPELTQMIVSWFSEKLTE